MTRKKTSLVSTTISTKSKHTKSHPCDDFFDARKYLTQTSSWLAETADLPYLLSILPGTFPAEPAHIRMFLVDLLKLLVLSLQLRDPVTQFFFPGPAWLRTDPFPAPVFQAGFSHFLIFQGPGADLLVLHFDRGKTIPGSFIRPRFP